MTIKVGLVLLGEFLNRYDDIILDDSGYALGPDHMIRRQRATRHNIGSVLLRGKISSRTTVVKTCQHRALRNTTHRASNRRKLQSRDRHGRNILRVGLITKCPLRSTHEINHASITFVSVVCKAEDAMMHQHHAFQLRPVNTLGHLRNGLREKEARHDVRHNQNFIAIKVSYSLLTSGGIAESNHGIGMGVIHESKRNQRVKNRLNRGRWRRGIDHRCALGFYHLGVTQRLEL